MAYGVPFVISSGGFRGILEAYQRFDLVNAIRVPMSVLNLMGPVLTLPYSHSLPVVGLDLGHYPYSNVACVCVSGRKD